MIKMEIIGNLGADAEVKFLFVLLILTNVLTNRQV